MKKQLLTICVLAASALFASAADRPTTAERIAALKENLQPITLRQVHNAPRTLSAAEAREARQQARTQAFNRRETELKTQENANRFRGFDVSEFRQAILNGEVRSVRNDNRQLHRLDSLLVTDSNGNNVMLERYVFDGRNWPVSFARFFWYNNSWTLYVKQQWEFNSDGFLTTQLTTYSDGFQVRFQFTYNDRGLADSQILSIREDESQIWFYIEKLTFVYAAESNLPIEINVFEYDYDWLNWVQTMQEIAAWDEWGRQIAYEEWIFDASGNKHGFEREIRNFLPGEAGVFLGGTAGYQTMHTIWRWNASENDWIYHIKQYREWTDEDAFGLRQPAAIRLYRWNSADNDWTGNIQEWWGDTLYNEKTLFTYDNEQKRLSERFYHFIGTEWVLSFYFDFSWSKAGGEWEVFRESFWVINENETTPQDRLWQRFDVNFPTHIHGNGMTRERFERFNRDTGIWVPIYEEISAFDDAGRMIEYKSWFYDDNGVRFAEFYTTYTFDELGNLILRVGKVGQETSDDDWLLRVTIKYEWRGNVMLTERWYYGENLEPSFGFSIEYDFNVPRSELLVFANFDFPYKWLIQNEYTGEGSGFAVSYTARSFWTMVNATSVHTPNEILLNVFPNPVQNILNINTEQVIMLIEVIDLQGRTVLQQQGNNRTIDLQALPAGIYTLRIHTEAGAVSMRIVKQ